jgi:hypothetical protein
MCELAAMAADLVARVAATLASATTWADVKAVIGVATWLEDRVGNRFAFIMFQTCFVKCRIKKTNARSQCQHIDAALCNSNLKYDDSHHVLLRPGLAGRPHHDDAKHHRPSSREGLSNLPCRPCISRAVRGRPDLEG